MAYFEGAEAVQSARELRAEDVDDRVDTTLVSARFCFDGNKLRVSASNVGRSTIDTLNVTILVDGIVTPGFVANVETNRDAGFWEPGFNATFNKTGYAAAPERVVLFTPEGVPAYASFYTCPALNTIVITPASAGLDIGEQKEFTAVGYDQFGALYIPEPYQWTSSCGTITTIDYDTIRFTAGTVSGACVLTASSEDVSKDAPITIDPDPPASMVVSPDPRGVPAGGSATFTTVIRDQYGNVNATSVVTWSTNAGTVTSGGVLTAQTTAQMGRSVTATTTHGVSDSATVDVYAAVPQTALVSPDPEDVTVGATETFSVVLRDAYNNVNSTAPVTWTTNVGTITSGGAFTAQTTPANGIVTATSGAASDSATVRVMPGAPSSLVVSPDPTTVGAGGTRQFSVVAYDSYGNVNATAPITWSTNAGAIDGAGLLTAQTLAQNGRSVTATTTGGVSDSATIDVWPSAPATAVVTPEGAGVTVGRTQQYGVVLSDAYGNVNTTAPVTWSTNGGTISAAGVLTAQTTAASGRSVTATSGAASDSAAVDVIADEPVAIAVSPDGAGVRAGTQQTYTAARVDQYGNVNGTATVTWSTNAGSISAGGVLTVQTTAQNGLTVTATWEEVIDSATVDVWPDAPASVVVAPDPRGVPAGGSASFTATLRDQYSNLNTTATVAWSTNAGSVSAGGVLTAQTTAQMGRSVTATSNGVSDSATVDVYAAATSTITVSPATPTVYLNRTQQFTATARDAYNNVNASVAITWGATSGSITTGGLYTAPSTGGSVTVTATGDGVQGTATVSVRREVHVDAMATYKAGVPSSSFRKGVDTVEVRTTVRDHENALVAGGATVTIEFVDDDNIVRHTASGTTSAGGIASASFALPASSKAGLWTARVTTIAGTNLVYNSAANVVSSVTFNVTNN